MRVAVLQLLLVSMLAGGCATPDDDRHSPLAAAQRVLAIDFGPQAFGRRMDGLQRAPGALAGEFRRTSALQTGLPAVEPELARVAVARQRLGDLAGREAARRPQAAADVAHLPQRWTQDLVDALANAPYVLGLHRRPLGERDDRQHRTDPDDQRPEATLWQRIARRLRLAP
jgi:hypothetical protein